MARERDRYDALWRETLQELSRAVDSCKRPLDSVILKGVIVNMLLLREITRELQLIEDILTKMSE